VLLVDGADQTLAQLGRSGGFDLVLLPARRRPLRRAYHPEAARLRVSAVGEIRIVERASQPQLQPQPQRPGVAAD